TGPAERDEQRSSTGPAAEDAPAASAGDQDADARTDQIVWPAGPRRESRTRPGTSGTPSQSTPWQSPPPRPFAPPGGPARARPAGRSGRWRIAGRRGAGPTRDAAAGTGRERAITIARPGPGRGTGTAARPEPGRLPGTAARSASRRVLRAGARAGSGRSRAAG